MSQKYIKLKREELFEQVWNEPISKLVKQYALSDVGLAKICKKMGIPRPERGHWARVYSSRPPKPRLPKLKDDQVTEVVVRVSESPAAVEAYEGLESGEWAFWASQQADRLDPLVASPTSVLDEKLERYW